MHNRHDDALPVLILISIVLVGLACFMIVRNVSGLLHLDMASCAWFLFNVAIFLLTVVIVLLKDWAPERMWPLLLVGLWLCIWPAIKYWASSHTPFENFETVAWWGAWYTRWGVLAALLGSSYLYWQHDRY